MPSNIVSIIIMYYNDIFTFELGFLNSKFCIKYYLLFIIYNFFLFTYKTDNNNPYIPIKA